MTSPGRRLLLLRAASLAAAFGSVQAFAAAAAVATGVGDPLQRPALASRLASTSLLTAVTRAGDRLVAVGERGIILVSADGGREWLQAKVPVSVVLTAVRFATPERGWAVGHSGVVLMTRDGGRTWALQLDGSRAARIVHDSVVAETGDSPELRKRRAEAERLVGDGADKPFLDLLVTGDNAVTVVGAFGLALHSDDGGTTWQTWDRRLPNTGASHLYGIAAAGDSLVIAGEQGVLFGSADQGRSFNAIASPSKSSFFGLVLVSERQWLVYGLRGQAFVSSDAGASWRPSRIESPGSLTAGLLRRDGSVVLGSERGDLFVSNDAGASFRHVAVAERMPVVGIAEAADRGLVLAGARGMVRLSPAVTGSGARP